MQETSPILSIKVKGQEEPVLLQTGIKGKLIEINKAIVDNPQLLLEETGFLFIIKSKIFIIFFEKSTFSNHRHEKNLLKGIGRTWLYRFTFAKIRQGPIHRGTLT